MINLSSFIITWVEVRPTTGRKVTLSDAKKMDVTVDWNGNGYRFFRDKAIALAWLNRERKLSKVYEARLFSDHQFGMRKAPHYDVPFTAKQLNEVYLLK